MKTCKICNIPKEFSEFTYGKRTCKNCINFLATENRREKYSKDVPIINLSNEVWLPVVGFEFGYEVSNKGRIKSLERVKVAKNKLMTPKASTNKYPFIALRKEGKTHQLRVHRLVAQAFIPNPENKPEVNHKDRDVSNNNVENLEWVTKRENCIHFGASVNQSSKFPGVSWNKRNNKWEVKIMFRHVHYYLGKYLEENTAGKKYSDLRIELENLPETATSEKIQTIVNKFKNF